MKVCTNTIGAIHEMKAAIWLMEQGYQVFSNVKATGAADLVAWNPETNESRFIDVKTVRRYLRADGSVSYSTSYGNHRTNPNIEYLGYCPEEDSFMALDGKQPKPQD